MLKRKKAEVGTLLGLSTIICLSVGVELPGKTNFQEIIGVMRMNDVLQCDWAGERDFPF
jgi:hypothetical protein